MELDAVSVDSDETDSDADLSINENGVYYPGDLPSVEEENHPPILEAKIVYLLLPKNVAISRTARLQWLLDRLNSVIAIPSVHKWGNSTEIEILSIVPREHFVTKCNKFLITSRTEVRFLAESYRLVYCLDMSPSQATIDIQKNEVLFDDLLKCFKSSLEELVKEFIVPCSVITFRPTLFLTIIVNTPFFMSPAQQVLVKGIELTNANLPDIVHFVSDQFHLIEEKIAEVSRTAYDSTDVQSSDNEKPIKDSPDLLDTMTYESKISMVSPDANFVNMMRYSMLAVSLLPENSISHIVVITDGIVAVPDTNILESLILQLHYDCTSVSFLKIGSPFHPNSSSGFVSHTDLLYFFAHSTLGTCLELPSFKNESVVFNFHQDLLLLWSFHNKNRSAMPAISSDSWITKNEMFYSHKKTNILRKRHMEQKTNISILILLSRRLREGFTIDHITYINGLLDIKLSLEWKSSVFIHYKMSTQWPPVKSHPTVHEVFIAAPYEFLHDITCSSKKGNIKSSFRVATIDRFWLRLSQLTNEVAFAQQLSTFPMSSFWYNLPESTRNGIPVFIMNTLAGENLAKLTPNNTSCPKFYQLWQPICQLEGNNWRKWLHMHKISLILKHDQQFHKILHLNPSSRRYQLIQCRQAASALYGLLSEWSTFILIDNSTYVKLIHKESDKPPISFCIIRVTAKMPCIVLHVGFLTPTPGTLRRQMLDDLKADISTLSYAPGPLKTRENTICVIFEKPIEKLLIRYERVPHDFSTVIFPDGTQPLHSNLAVPLPFTSSLFTTLSRYLYHKRSIWGASYSANCRLSENGLSWILNTLTKMRLEEGFHFAHSSAGIITMVMELWMDPQASCLVQYVLFPANYSENSSWAGNSNSSEDENYDGETELQLVTEVWIEPQHGKVLTTNKRINYLNNKFYYEIANIIGHIDHKCINTLLTMEFLSMKCQEKHRTFSLDSASNLFNSAVPNQKIISRSNSTKGCQEATPELEDGSLWYPIAGPNIEHIPFNFRPIDILPFCQQTELLFSLFIEQTDRGNSLDTSKGNKLLMDTIHDHFTVLHDTELDLTAEESIGFMKQINNRRRNRSSSVVSMSRINVNELGETQGENKQISQWRCLLKGISVSHVVLTFLPATLDDLRMLFPAQNSFVSKDEDDDQRPNSSSSNYSNVSINVGNSLTLPIYVYDCPLAVLVNAHVKNLDEHSTLNRDIHEDHRFKFFDGLHEESVRLKEQPILNPEPKSDESEMSDPRNSAKLHSRALVLAYSKSFVISQFIALHYGAFTHSSDIQSAMDQCEESITEVDITNYILTVCGHVKNLKEDRIEANIFNHATPCNELRPFHELIKKRFMHVISQFFTPVPTNDEFYFYQNDPPIRRDSKQNDSDDDSSRQSKTAETGSNRESSFHSEDQRRLQRLESGFSGVSDLILSDVHPLFLHLICTIRYNNTGNSNMSVRVLPTCLGELIQRIQDSTEYFDKSKLQVSLDILSLTLPNKVQNVITEYSSKGLRSTSFCSDGFQPSVGSPTSETSFTEIQDPEPLVNLLDFQKNAIVQLRDSIKWLLMDETATALLDVEPVTFATLNTIVHHVNHNTSTSTCNMDKIDLNFVNIGENHHDIFKQEFAKLTISSFKFCKEGDFYYLAKDITNSTYYDFSDQIGNGDIESNFVERKMNEDDGMGDDLASQLSDISSIGGSVVSEAGYDEDVSEDYEDYDWLSNIDIKRKMLPNFWLIVRVDQDVTIYFHCRFLKLPTPKVGIYLEILRNVKDAIMELCKKVNQSLLLQALYETKICNNLLEPEDKFKERQSDLGSSSTKSSLSRSKSKTGLSLEKNEDTDDSLKSNLDNETFKPGEFSCPVVWQTHFILHPRLKTGPGKSIISRGILALKNILDKFSVSNRNNMFVYKDQVNNVFYLRLQENVQMNCGKPSSARPNEYESALVSRSPSIASLPLGQRGILGQSDASISSSISNEIRPRVRSFGEKESKNYPNEDTLILKVHGITMAGRDVQLDLVQVLQNRLDDAVLEFLSITLARNAMCPLTPEDVHFIQKPFRPPEIIIRLTIQEFAFRFLDSFLHYLKQNLLQFLNIPKYTDVRNHFHFKDYTENNTGNNMLSEDNIFIYNQSQNPSSGNRGIACITLNLINNLPLNYLTTNDLITNINLNEFKNVISTREILSDDPTPEIYLEFRLWKQGRVNIDNLVEKLKSTVCQAAWDLILEYHILIEPLCKENEVKVNPIRPIVLDDLDSDFSKEIEFNVLIDNNLDDKVRGSSKIVNLSKLNKTAVFPKKETCRSLTFEGTITKRTQFTDEGCLSMAYAKFLPDWLEYGVNLSVPAVRKHKVTLMNKHPTSVFINELINLIQDTSKVFYVTPKKPFSNDDDCYEYVSQNPSSFLQKSVVVSRNSDLWEASVYCRDDPELLHKINPKILKHSQKYTPLTDNVFVPRQKILWSLVESDNVTLYTYNWTKEKIDKLITNCTNLGLWLNVRSSFLNSAISQKLGLFHDQHLARKSFLSSNNPYAWCVGFIDHMKELPKEIPRRIMTNNSNLARTIEVFRDTFQKVRYPSSDIVVVLVKEMREIKRWEEKWNEEMKKLHSMYQSRTSSTTVPLIHLLMQNSRIIHYCHTPLLFLPRWRLKSASTRDNTLYPNSLKDEPSSPEEESWHLELSYSFFCEYRRYLQTLGFMPLQFDDNRKPGLWSKDNSSYDSVFYIQKTILGGILLFTAEFVEPFFATRLHAIECNRLQHINSRASINRFTLSFLDECDRVKIYMHLHSFTYDCHLRYIHDYVSSNTNGNRITENYNVNQFLDDFVKYYNKAPNFARNLVHQDTLTVRDLVTEGKQLFDYLLQNVDQYNFKTLKMEKGNGGLEKILVQVTSTSQVYYRDSQDCQHTDDFEITLIIHNLCYPFSPTDNILHLKYYLILTSKRELYPASGKDEKLGKFRTVSSASRIILGTTKEAVGFSAKASTDSSDKPDQEDDTILLYHKENDEKNYEFKSDIGRIEISTEKVNYLGYYSSHEQLMQQLMMEKAAKTKAHVEDMVRKGMVHCRSTLLWNKLVNLDSHLTYNEFIELKSLANLELLSNIHRNLAPLLNQPISWYEGLSKLLLVKYNEHKKTFVSPDGYIQHFVILHSSYQGAFMLLSIDMHMSRGDLYAVTKEISRHEDVNVSQAYRKQLLDGFVNCIAFYLWSGMV